MSRVVFPRVSQITASREDLVALIRQQFPASADPRRTWFVSGGESTQSLAKVYRRLWEGADAGDPAVLSDNSGREDPVVGSTPYERASKRLFDQVWTAEPRPSMLIYVGGQSVGDVVKYAAWLFNQKQAGAPSPTKDGGLKFGGIITTLSSDGVYSPTASLRDDDGLPVSRECEAPAFVVGHELTLLRQPYKMKCACVGDMLAKVSSLWDYRHSCRVLGLQPNDFAADLTQSSYQWFLDRGATLDPGYLQKAESIKELFRAVQLSGLAMQVEGTTQACSGSEHVGQKWLEDFFINYNRISGSREAPMHGIGAFAMSIVTAYMQGQADYADKVRKIADTLTIPYANLGVPDFPSGFVRELMETCLCIGFGYRCPRHVTRLCQYNIPDLRDRRFEDEPPSRSGPESGRAPDGEIDVGNVSRPERITILDEPEYPLLRRRIQSAIADSRLFDQAPANRADADQGALIKAAQALQVTKIRAWTRLKRRIEALYPRCPDAGELIGNELRVRVFGLDR